MTQIKDKNEFEISNYPCSSVSSMVEMYLQEASLSYILSTADDKRAMLEAIGAASVSELFANVPPEVRRDRPWTSPRHSARSS